MKIEGKNAVAELIKTPKTVDKILVQNGLRDNESRELVRNLRAQGYKVQFVEKAILDMPNEIDNEQIQSAISYLEHVLEDWGTWRTHHETLCQAIETLLEVVKDD